MWLRGIFSSAKRARGMHRWGHMSNGIAHLEDQNQWLVAMIIVNFHALQGVSGRTTTDAELERKQKPGRGGQEGEGGRRADRPTNRQMHKPAAACGRHSATPVGVVCNWRCLSCGLTVAVSCSLLRWQNGTGLLADTRRWQTDKLCTLLADTRRWRCCSLLLLTW